ncbi:MAG: hypothetical protein J0L63_18955 [Anaerolineae bacterium]|nr:hypothetical protein [Anaerolineae bacterium]
MSGGLARAAAVMTAVFWLGISLMRVYPTDDAALRALVMPEGGCAAPCLMGIRAGETGMQDALMQLVGHAWVKDLPSVMRPIDDINAATIYWNWNGSQPALVDANWKGEIRLHRQVALSVLMKTTVPLGAVWLLLGETERGVVIPSEMRPGRDVSVILVYPDYSLLVRVNAPKQSSWPDLWGLPVEIESVNGMAVDYFGGYRLPRLCGARCAG